MYDITDAESFKRVEAWVTELREQVKEGISIIIAGNKCDLEKNRNVNKAEAEAYATSHLGAPDCTSLHPGSRNLMRVLVCATHSYAKSVGAKHIETSAKLGKNLDRVFLELTKRNQGCTEQKQGITIIHSLTQSLCVCVYRRDASQLADNLEAWQEGWLGDCG